MCLSLISSGNVLRVTKARNLDPDQSLPFSAANKTPVDSGELWGCRKRSKFLQQERLKAFDLFRVLSQHFDVGEN